MGNLAHVNDNTAPETIKINEKEMVYADLEGKFQAYYVLQVNIINESTVINKRKQGATESINDFMVDLQKLVLTCDYSDPDHQVRDWLIAGFYDDKLQEKLQFMSDVTLSKAFEYARRWEMIQAQLKEQHGNKGLQANEVNRSYGHHGRGPQGPGHGRGRR